MIATADRGHMRIKSVVLALITFSLIPIFSMAGSWEVPPSRYCVVGAPRCNLTTPTPDTNTRDNLDNFVNDMRNNNPNGGPKPEIPSPSATAMAARPTPIPKTVATTTASGSCRKTTTIRTMITGAAVAAAVAEEAAVVAGSRRRESAGRLLRQRLRYGHGGRDRESVRTSRVQTRRPMSSCRASGGWARRYEMSAGFQRALAPY